MAHMSSRHVWIYAIDPNSLYLPLLFHLQLTAYSVDSLLQFRSIVMKDVVTQAFKGKNLYMDLVS